MVVEVNRLVRREQVVVVRVRERVRVLAFGAEDHQVCDVYDTDAKGGQLSAEERGGGDDFERDFDADTDKNAEMNVRGRSAKNKIASVMKCGQTYTSGLSPSSVLAKRQIDAPAIQC